MRKLIVGGSVMLMACMMVTGCGDKKTADGREIKARPNTGETIDPPEKMLQDNLKGSDQAGKK